MKGLMNVDMLKKLPETDIILRPIDSKETDNILTPLVDYVPIEDFNNTIENIEATQNEKNKRILTKVKYLSKEQKRTYRLVNNKSNALNDRIDLVDKKVDMNKNNTDAKIADINIDLNDLHTHIHEKFKGMKILDIMILSGILLNFIFEIILMVIYSRGVL